MNESPFWMVYVEEGQNPTIKHVTEALARLEAVRLARKLGKPAYVLQAIAKCERVDVVWTELDPSDEIPF